MRALFLLLLLGNLAFFAWWHYYSPIDPGADPLPLSRQIEPDKLRIISPADVPPAAAAKAAPSAPALVAATPAGVPLPASLPAPASPNCMEWGSFTLADAPRAEKALEPLSLGERLGQRRTEEQAGWWVFSPPQGNRQTAMRKAAELKGLGISEFFVVAEDARYRWAISLGVFRNEEAAQARLAALKQQGVRSAQVGPREMMVPKVWLQVKGVDGTLAAKLKELASQIEGSDLKPCI